MAKFNSFLLTLAKLSFAAMIIVLPFRWRIVIAARPIGTIYKDYTDILLFAPDLFLLVTIACWLIISGIEHRRVNLGTPLVAIPLAGLTTVAIITSFFSIDPALSFYHSARIVLLGALYLYVTNEVRSLAWVTIPLAIQIFIQGIIGIGQSLQQHSVGLQPLGEYELDPLWSGVSVVVANGVRVLRAYGLTDHPNILGGCMAFAMILRAARFGEARPRAKVLTGIVFTLGAITLFLTFSRAAYGALALGIVVIGIALWRTHQKGSLVQLALLVVIALIFVLPIAWQNMSALGLRALGAASASENALEIRSLAERNALNSVANRIFAAHPILGIGIGTLPEGVEASFPQFEFYAQPAHIALLDAAAETGIFGAFFYLALVLSPWIGLGINRKRIRWTAPLVGTSALLAAITAIGFFDYYTWLLVPGRLWQWTAWGLWNVAYQNAMVN